MSGQAVPLCAFALVVMASSGSIPARTLEGRVLAFEPGRSLVVVNEQTDPTGLEFLLRGVRIEPRDVLAPGARVTVWFRTVGERRPITDRVKVLAP
jgi:hypothetical protein